MGRGNIPVEFQIKNEQFTEKIGGRVRGSREVAAAESNHMAMGHGVGLSKLRSLGDPGEPRWGCRL